MKMLEWEKIDSEKFTMWRCQIRGGWLVSTMFVNPDDSQTRTMTFVPDDLHRWQ